MISAIDGAYFYRRICFFIFCCTICSKALMDSEVILLELALGTGFGSDILSSLAKAANSSSESAACCSSSSELLRARALRSSMYEGLWEEIDLSSPSPLLLSLGPCSCWCGISSLNRNGERPSLHASLILHNYIGVLRSNLLPFLRAEFGPTNITN